MTEGGNAGARASKSTQFLRSFEDYISEVITSNHGMKENEMLKIIKNNFERSIRANIDYHLDLLRACHKEGDKALEKYHDLMAKSYRSVLRAK